MKMKNGLRIGDVVQARVENITAQDQIVASISGHFYSVLNQTNEVFKIGDIVALYVESASPIRFKIKKAKHSGHIEYHA